MKFQYLVTIIIGLAIVSATQMAEAKKSTNLIKNSGFEKNFDNWEQMGKAEFSIDSKVKFKGKKSAKITVAPDIAPEYQRLCVTVPAEPGKEYIAKFMAKCENTTGGAGLYGAIEFLKDGQRITYNQGAQTRGNQWHQHIVEAKAPADAQEIRLSIVLHANGTVWIDDAILKQIGNDPLSVEFTLQADKLISDNWLGFGFQGDMLLDRDFNKEHGITNEDRELVKQRVKSIQPQIVRLVFQLGYWEPERGKQTPNSEGMADLKKTIAIYKEIGSDIHLTEWGHVPPAWARPTGIIPHREETDNFTKSFTAAIKYLRDDCGFDNIKYVTIYNEPNGGNVPKDEYIRIYRSFDRSLKDAGIREQVSILGPDEAINYDWLPWAITDLDDVIDYYDAHNYASDSGKQFAAWVEPRVQDMPKSALKNSHPPNKRFMVTEFGMHDQMETFSSPHNGKYEYGIYLADSAISACDKGASAMMMWCMMDTYYYTGLLIKWGLWRYKDENWEPRPGFYSWSLINRYTKRGSYIHKVKCSTEDAVSVAFKAPGTGIWTLMVVNRRKTERPFSIKELDENSLWKAYIYSRDTIPTRDRDMIRPSSTMIADDDGIISGTLPPESFVLFHQQQ